MTLDVLFCKHAILTAVWQKKPTLQNPHVRIVKSRHPRASFSSAFYWGGGYKPPPLEHYVYKLLIDVIIKYKSPTHPPFRVRVSVCLVCLCVSARAGVCLCLSVLDHLMKGVLLLFAGLDQRCWTSLWKESPEIVCEEKQQSVTLGWTPLCVG